MPTAKDIDRYALADIPDNESIAYSVWSIVDVIYQGFQDGYRITGMQAEEILDAVQDYNSGQGIDFNIISTVIADFKGPLEEYELDDDEDPWALADSIAKHYRKSKKPAPFIDEHGEKWDGFEGPIVESEELSPRHINDQDKVDRLTMEYLENLVAEFHPGTTLDWNTAVLHTVHDAARKALFDVHGIRIPYAFMEDK